MDNGNFLARLLPIYPSNSKVRSALAASLLSAGVLFLFSAAITLGIKVAA